jgi:hypothetical protein
MWKKIGSSVCMNPVGDNNSNKDLWDQIYKRFRNDVCKDCCNHILPFREMSKPQPIPHIGSSFSRDRYRLLFVGIETYCNEKRDNCEETDYDVFNRADVKSLFLEMNPKENGRSLFWKWVKKISVDILETEPEEAFEHIAYSNLHKCQSRKKGGDLCSPRYEICEKLSKNCIQKAGWLYREIEKIGAINVILFSGRRRECLLAKLFLDDNEGRLIKWRNHGKVLFTQLRDGAIRFIITNHPQGTPLEVREEIVRIIKHNDWKNAIDWKMPRPYK